METAKKVLGFLILFIIVYGFALFCVNLDEGSVNYLNVLLRCGIFFGVCAAFWYVLLLLRWCFNV